MFLFHTILSNFIFNLYAHFFQAIKISKLYFFFTLGTKIYHASTQVVSVVNHMVSLSFINTTFIDLGNIILLCMIILILRRRSTASDAKKSKVSKINDIKTC